MATFCSSDALVVAQYIVWLAIFCNRTPPIVNSAFVTQAIREHTSAPHHILLLMTETAEDAAECIVS
jgi:hypothetical protein